MDRRIFFVLFLIRFCRRKQVSLVARRVEEMNNSWKTFVINVIEADLLKERVLNMLMNCILNEFVDNLDCFQRANCKVQWASLL